MFPHRISWLRTIALITIRALTTIVALVFLGLNKLNGLPIESQQVLSGIYFFYAWVITAFLMGLWNHLALVLEGKTKVWKIKKESVWEAGNAFKIYLYSDLIALGFLVCGFMPILHLATVSNISVSSVDSDRAILVGCLFILLILATFCVWVISMPILYQQELNKELRRTPKKATQKKPVTTTKSKPKTSKPQ